MVRPRATLAATSYTPGRSRLQAPAAGSELLLLRRFHRTWRLTSDHCFSVQAAPIHFDVNV
jgi:hypothetical protein